MLGRMISLRETLGGTELAVPVLSAKDSGRVVQERDLAVRNARQLFDEVTELVGEISLESDDLLARSTVRVAV
jgi:hypothetical protein